MPEVRIDVNMGGFETHFDMQEAVVKLQKQLRWLLRHLDSMNVQFISTNMTEVKSEDGTTHLDGSQLKMKDSDGNIRLVMGYNPETGNYEFTMRNKAGVETLLIDEDGDAIFTGTVAGSKIIGTEIEGGKITGAEIEGGTIKSGATIDVETDLRVGNNVYLGKEDNNPGATKNVQFFDGAEDSKKARIEAKVSSGGSTELMLKAIQIQLSAPSGVVDWTGRPFITGNGVNGSFVSQDGKTVAVSNGLISSIT